MVTRAHTRPPPCASLPPIPTSFLHLRSLPSLFRFFPVLCPRDLPSHQAASLSPRATYLLNAEDPHAVSVNSVCRLHNRFSYSVSVQLLFVSRASEWRCAISSSSPRTPLSLPCFCSTRGSVALSGHLDTLLSRSNSRRCSCVAVGKEALSSRQPCLHVKSNLVSRARVQSGVLEGYLISPADAAHLAGHLLHPAVAKLCTLQLQN
eukprot:6186770-Pleurochrysis_carterae.AAC.1